MSNLTVYTYPVHVAGERLEWVHDDEVATGEGVDEAGAVALPQDVEDAGLVEVSQINKILDRVLLRRVRLSGQRERERWWSDHMTVV